MRSDGTARLWIPAGPLPPEAAGRECPAARRLASASGHAETRCARRDRGRCDHGYHPSGNSSGDTIAIYRDYTIAPGRPAAGLGLPRHLSSHKVWRRTSKGACRHALPPTLGSLSCAPLVHGARPSRAVEHRKGHSRRRPGQCCSDDRLSIRGLTTQTWKIRVTDEVNPEAGGGHGYGPPSC